MTQSSQTYRFSPEDVPELEADRTYLIYDYFRRTIRVCDGRDQITAELQVGGFAWYQILPFEGEAMFLGLTEKYGGFSAVEDVFLTEEGMTGVIREQGPMRFVCNRTPGRVFCNGADVTELVVKENGSSQMDVYTIALNTKSARAVLDIRWDK